LMAMQDNTPMGAICVSPTMLSSFGICRYRGTS
jgi:enhancing lycopene biosynthesis protein 2